MGIEKRESNPLAKGAASTALPFVVTLSTLILYSRFLRALRASVVVLPFPFWAGVRDQGRDAGALRANPDG